MIAGPRGARDGLASAVRPAREPGEELDGLECTGDRVASPAARPTSATGLRALDPHWHAEAFAGLRTGPFATPFRISQPLSPGDATCPIVPPRRRNGRPEIDVEDLHRLVLQSLDDDQAVESSPSRSPANRTSPTIW